MSTQYILWKYLYFLKQKESLLKYSRILILVSIFSRLRGIVLCETYKSYPASCIYLVRKEYLTAYSDNHDTTHSFHPVILLLLSVPVWKTKLYQRKFYSL